MFKLLQYEFVQNAFLAGTIIAILAPVIGYFVVLRAQAFAGHALSHIGFAGATGAALLGINSLLGMFALTLLAALGIGAWGERVRGRDVEIGMVLSFALGLGVLFLSLYTQYATETVSVLFGSIFSVTRENVLITLACGLAALLLIILMFRPLLFASIDPEVAQSRGVPVRWLSIGFLLLLAITVSVTVQVVGVLLVFALLIAPAATAARLAHRPTGAIALAILLGLAFTWGGLVLAFASRWPVSFCIAALASLSYIVTVQVGLWRTPRRYRALPHPNREYI
ncbi:MAG: metal ABC transporter permease [Chloroflexi bacterium]|nr:metal ABC transporter permease [Chloroflexota bacterium]